MQLPTIPAFSTGESSMTHLQQLGAAVRFVTVAEAAPMWRLYRTATQSIASGSWVTCQFNSALIDTDNLATGANDGVTIVTQGYYDCEACLPFTQENSGVNNCQGSFLWTAGPSNANFAAGTTRRFGGTAQSAATGTTTDYVYCMADICPVVCYPGDTIVVQAFLLFTTSLNILSNTSNTSGWFCPQFSGRWIRTGS
jgi:hypothetical protein